MMNLREMLVISALTFAQLANAQTSTPKYDQHEAFAPLFQFQPGNPFRSGTGSPGPMYWQNRADYKINAKLDEAANSITGDVEITYKITALIN